MTALGRIDIRFTDGHSETHLLELTEVTVGGGQDNAIRVGGAGLAAQHIRFSQRDGAVFLTHLAAGYVTTVDGQPAPLNQPQRLDDIAHIRAGELSIVFHQGSDSPTVSMSALADVTQPAAGGFRAYLEAGEVKVWPFSSASVELSVANLMADEARFIIKTAGLPAAWTTPENLTFFVAGNDAIDLLLHIKPPRRPELAPGKYPLTITIRRLGEHDSLVQFVLLVQLGGFGGLSAALDHPVGQPQSPFNVYLLNLGNEGLSLKLRPCADDQRLQVELEQHEVRLGPGERAVVGGTAAPKRRPLVGLPEDVGFALVADAVEPNIYLVTLPGSITIKPVIGYRLLTAAALVILALAAAFGAWRYQPPQPQITAFTSSESQPAQGTLVELSWDAIDAQGFVIEVERVPIAELPSAASSYRLDTSSYVDPVDIALIALNGDAEDIASLRLDVFEPVVVGRLEASKAALLRHIEGELTVRWRVEGAVALDIALPAGFETIKGLGAGNEGEITIKGAPASAFHITLTAEDEIGGITTRSLAIAIEAPECSPLRDALLYAGPGARFARVDAAVQHVPVLAKAITAAADWIQVELANGVRGWGRRAHFRCSGFDPAELPVTADLPPPPPTAAPTATFPPPQTPTFAATGRGAQALAPTASVATDET